MTYVPFDSTALYQQAITAGDPHIGLMPELSAIGWGEKIRYVAQTGEQRSASFPDVPIFAELGLPQIKGVNYAFCVRSGAPDANVQKLNDAVNRAVTQQQVRIDLGRFLMELRVQTLAQAREMLAGHVRAVTEIASRMGVRQQ
jgi:tripartite-type tricarboxylate transporter receptor subunit TctC